VQVLQRAYGRDAIAAAYAGWLDTAIARQVPAARPLRSWLDVTAVPAPPGWGSDLHGFLCRCCGHRYWQVITSGDLSGRLCTSCAPGMGLAPGAVWEPARPLAHHGIAWPGTEPDARLSSVRARWSGGGTTEYTAGDAEAFLAPAGPADPAVTDVQLAGQPDAPRMQVSGTAGAGAGQLLFTATLDLDWSPQEPRGQAYGFRFTTGALSGGSPLAFADLVDFLTAIAARQAPPGCSPIPGPAAVD